MAEFENYNVGESNQGFEAPTFIFVFDEVRYTVDPVSFDVNYTRGEAGEITIRGIIREISDPHWDRHMKRARPVAPTKALTETKALEGSDEP